MDKEINKSEMKSEKYPEQKLDKEYEKKPSKPRCSFCNKKLKMIHFNCKCNHKFCILHQNPHSHNCSFNNKKLCQETIKNNNPQMIHQKVIQI